MNEDLIKQMALDYANNEGGSPFACIALKRAYEQGMRDALKWASSNK